MKFSEIIHYNRDENSFTARVFENYLIPLWSKTPETFQPFLKMLSLESEHNHDLIQKRLKHTFINKFDQRVGTFSDSMLFLEHFDIYGFCRKNGIQIDIDQDNIDKTEFDCVVVMEDEFNNEEILVFEVKCFTDLTIKEVERQNVLLQKYKAARLFNDFHHFAILSAENIQRGKVFNNKTDKLENGLHVISWTGLVNYIDHFIPDPMFPRFIRDIEFNKLYKTITKSGQRKFRRKLIASKKFEYLL